MKKKAGRHGEKAVKLKERDLALRYGKLLDNHRLLRNRKNEKTVDRQIGWHQSLC